MRLKSCPLSGLSSFCLLAGSGCTSAGGRCVPTSESPIPSRTTYTMRSDQYPTSAQVVFRVVQEAFVRTHSSQSCFVESVEPAAIVPSSGLNARAVAVGHGNHVVLGSECSTHRRCIRAGTSCRCRKGSRPTGNASGCGVRRDEVWERPRSGSIWVLQNRWFVKDLVGDVSIRRVARRRVVRGGVPCTSPPRSPCRRRCLTKRNWSLNR